MHLAGQSHLFDAKAINSIDLAFRMYLRPSMRSYLVICTSRTCMSILLATSVLVNDSRYCLLYPAEDYDAYTTVTKRTIPKLTRWCVC